MENDIINKIEEPTIEWGKGLSKSITFIVTDDCQLRCKYCYVNGKGKKGVMPINIAKKTIDYLISNGEVFNESSVILDFIGGEPLLEIELIDKICDYFKVKSYSENHPWFNSYRFSLSTNGLDYHLPKVQKFIKKNSSHIDIGFSIDGNKEKHNLNRIFPDGSGSYEKVLKNIPLWLDFFPMGSTKVTVASSDIPYIKESVIHLFNLGIKTVNINVVFEDLWKENDDILFEQQLKLLADEIINKKYYEDYHCSFFVKNIGNQVHSNQNWCGAGKMLAVDHTGNFYPCNRFTSNSLINNKPRIIGNCFEGIDFNKLRPFLSLDLISQSCTDCIDCDIAVGCAWCQGANYDFADSDTIFQRATFICKMHKARIRANNYFWDKYDKLMISENNGSKITA